MVSNFKQMNRWELYSLARSMGIAKRAGGYQKLFLVSWLRKYEKVLKVATKFFDDKKFFKECVEGSINNWQKATLTTKEIIIAKQFKKRLDHLKSVQELTASYQTPWGYGFFSMDSKYYANFTEIEDYAYGLWLAEISS